MKCRAQLGMEVDCARTGVVDQGSAAARAATTGTGGSLGKRIGRLGGLRLGSLIKRGARLWWRAEHGRGSRQGGGGGGVFGGNVNVMKMSENEPPPPPPPRPFL